MASSHPDTPDLSDTSIRVYSMVETAKANRLDLKKYLMSLLEKRPSTEISHEELAPLAP